MCEDYERKNQEKLKVFTGEGEKQIREQEHSSLPRVETTDKEGQRWSLEEGRQEETSVTYLHTGGPSCRLKGNTW